MTRIRQVPRMQAVACWSWREAELSRTSPDLFSFARLQQLLCLLVLSEGFALSLNEYAFFLACSFRSSCT